MHIDNIDLMLTKFGYTSNWLKYGLLELGFFNQQIADQNNTGHEGFEHYRYGAFCHWINSRHSASDDDVTNFIKLAMTDPDAEMGRSALIALIEAEWLTDQQFTSTKEHLLNITGSLHQCVTRQELFRELSKHGPTDELFIKCIENGDPKVQIKLLECKGVPSSMLEALSSSGATRKVRNIASQYLRSNKNA